MAYGAIAYPAFTNSHTVSNRHHFHSNVKAINVATSTSDTIDKNEDIVPSEVHYNLAKEEVRWVYTGSTKWYFMVQTNDNPFMIQIENVGGGDITSIQLKQSLNGLSWDIVGDGANILLVSGAIGANECYILQTIGEYYPAGAYVLLEVDCASDSKVALQTI